MPDQKATPSITALTSVRGVAAWWVVAYHFRDILPSWVPHLVQAFLSRGYLAVDLFFQLSGLVIALNYSDGMRKLNAKTVLNFLGLRLARIYPLHVFMLTAYILNPIVILLFSTNHELGSRYSASYFVLSLLLLQNWGFTNTMGWNIPAWSISTEWFSYLLFPLMIWLASRSIRNAVTALMAGVLLWAALNIVAFMLDDNLGGNIPGFGLLRCVMEFSMGVCLHFVISHQGRGRASSALQVVSIGLAAMAMIFPRYDVLLAPVAFSLLIYSLADSHNRLSRLLDNKPLETLGLISYSTYLVHYFVKDWIKFALSRTEDHTVLPFLCYLLITFFMSVLLYRLVEVPGRRFVRSVLLRL